ncbi:hypothetical protein [Candidatus Bathycorpusculum sp.]|uniref:hypothetical protein n=1 Tax=Candidatus Bathycorpusculum sp. TaxID=2994959 RepID=UPI00281E9A06|nr:hypothetical protein [Candidatus Termitimicrobium sp.]MCL2684985.1 hypothetical protein [Candidatus Termitimicrobium sp.]
MFDSADTNCEAYETIIGNTTFRVITRYIGEKSLIEVIKSAVKRDVEAIKNEEKEA